jgi:hypothetical protein
MNDLGRYAPPDVRDQFLAALDANDRVACCALAQHLRTCTNPLPSATCVELDLPLHSSYGAAAERVLDRQRAQAAHDSIQAFAAAASLATRG